MPEIHVMTLKYLDDEATDVEVRELSSSCCPTVYDAAGCSK